MVNVIVMNKVCSVCAVQRPITDFASYKNNKGEISYGLICQACSSPVGDDAKRQARSNVNDSQYAKKIDNYAIQTELAQHLRAFGEVDVPEEPGNKPSLSDHAQVFASEGNSYGSGMGGGSGKAHPILSEAAQFQEAPRNQTPNAADSDQYNKLQQELQLQKQLQARLAQQNRSMNTPSGPL
jgi:hypothetical protein